MNATRQRPLTLPTWLLGPGAVVFAASLAAYALTARVLHPGGTDLTIYLMGGNAYRHHLPIYDQQYLGWSFTYPPVSVLLFGPLSLLSHGTALAASMAFNIAAVVVVAWLTFQMLGYRRGSGVLGATLAVAAGGLWLQPIFDTLGQGQVNIALMLVVMADFALARYRRWPAGALIGAAAAIKLTPAIFVLYLLLTRRYRAAATAIGTFVGLTALGFAVAWSDSKSFWFTGIFSDSNRVAGPDGIDSAYNQSLHGVLVRALGIHAGNVAWYPVALVALACGLAVARAASRRGEEVTGIVAVALTGLLCSPLTWHEHWVWVVPAIVALIDLGRRIHASAPVTAGALPFLLWVSFLVWPLPGNSAGQLIPDSPLSPVHHAWKVGRHNLFVLGASAEYVVIGIGLLALAAWLMRRFPQSEPAYQPLAPREQGVAVDGVPASAGFRS